MPDAMHLKYIKGEVVEATKGGFLNPQPLAGKKPIEHYKPVEHYSGKSNIIKSGKTIFFRVRIL